MTITLNSPAKLNLFLRILRRREDGYHDLASLFQAVDLCDMLHLSLSEKDIFTCSDPNLALNDSNLVMKAKKVFFQKTGLNFATSIHLEKKIPIEAGLGGGSSNAATTLWGLNALSGFKVSESELQDWSAEIGADVPFFFSEGTAYCLGKGEMVEDLPMLPFSKNFTLIKPKVGLSTPQIFKELDLRECSSENPELILKSFFSNEPIFVNDLEKPAFRLLPFLAKLKQDSFVMTGSGTAFFSLSDHVPSELNPFFLSKVSSIRRTHGKWY